MLRITILLTLQILLALRQSPVNADFAIAVHNNNNNNKNNNAAAHNAASTGTASNDVCSPNPCPNNSICLPREGIAYCECSDGGYVDQTNGSTCSSPPDGFGSINDPCDPNPCVGGVTCVPDANTNKPLCQCPHGDFVPSNEDCPSDKSVTDNPCFGNACGSRVRCESDGTKAYCLCPDGGFVEKGVGSCIKEEGIPGNGSSTGNGGAGNGGNNNNNSVVDGGNNPMHKDTICSPNPCKGGGQECLPYNGVALCKCQDGGFVEPGVECDQAHSSTGPCKPNPCGDEDDACVPFEGQALCHCPDGGFVNAADGGKSCTETSKNVENNPCFGNTCGADIVCKGIHGIAYCQCPDKGFVQHGEHCTLDANNAALEHKTPHDGNVCLPNPCSEGVTCMPSNGEALCQCPDNGYVPADDGKCNTPLDPNEPGEFPCSPNPCPGRRTCIPFEGEALCKCDLGDLVKVGQKCPATSDENSSPIKGPCTLSPCQDGVKCEEMEGVAFCQCPDGGFIRNGNSCDLNEPLNACSPNPCGHGIKCMPMDQKPYCQCPDGGFVEKELVDKMCVPSSSSQGNENGNSNTVPDHACSPNYCRDGATCVVDGNDPGDALCRCPHGDYVGLNDACPTLEASDNPCFGNTCGPNINCEAINGIAYCICPDGGYVQHGNHCSVPFSNAVPGIPTKVPCAPQNPCPDGTQCLPFNGEAMCKCPDGGYIKAGGNEACHEMKQHGFETGGGPCSPNPCTTAAAAAGGGGGGENRKCIPFENIALCECPNGEYVELGKSCPHPELTQQQLQHPCEGANAGICGSNSKCEGIHGNAFCECPDGGFVLHGNSCGGEIKGTTTSSSSSTISSVSNARTKGLIPSSFSSITTEGGPTCQNFVCTIPGQVCIMDTNNRPKCVDLLRGGGRQ